MELIHQKMLPHAEMKLLAKDEIEHYLPQLHSRWELVENPAPLLRAQYQFDDFVKAMKFVNRVADLAQKEGHHPDIIIRYNNVNIALWSHYVNGLSLNDFIMAAKVDQI